MDDRTHFDTTLGMAPLALAPHPQAGLQWWFAQGHVSGATARWRVMMALFLARHDGVEGAMLLTHALNEITGESHRQARLTPGTLDIEDRIAVLVAQDRVPPWLPWLRRLALWRHRRDVTALAGHPAGYHLDPAPPRFAEAPFAASWGGVLLGHDPTHAALRLTLPLGSGTGLEAQAGLPDLVMNAGSATLSPAYGEGFHYQCAPGLPLRGQIGAEPVEGHLWLDRQWGEMEGWLYEPARRGKAMLGWDWFALTLSPDWQIMLNRHHLRPDGQARGSFAILFDKGRPLRLPSGFTATPTGQWHSPVTGAHYPVNWQVTIPDLACNVRLTPLSGDQELPLPGGLSVWEGAGTFEGDLDGAPIHGPARIELAGYAAILSIRDRMRRRARAS